MRKPVNHKMIKLEDVIKVLDSVSKVASSSTDRDLIDHIKRQVLKIDTKPRLTIINGGKND